MSQSHQEALRLHQAGQLDAAERMYQELLRADPSNHVVLHLLGVLALQRRRYQQSVDLIERAIVLNSGAAVYHFNIAAALRVLGRFDEAESHYRTSLRLKPDYAEALFNLSAVRRFNENDEIVADIERLLQTGGRSDNDQAFLDFAAGKVFDDIKQYDRAFEHYARANRLLATPFDPDVHRKFIDRLIEIFDEAFFEQHFGRGFASDLPVFVIGMPRSGTTLAEQILSAHPNVCGAGELPDIPSIIRTLPQHAAGAAYPDCVAALPTGAFAGFGKSYTNRLRTFSESAERVVDKLPGNFLHLGLIALLLPGAKIIHCRRDPLDTCLSCFFQRFRGGLEYAQDLTHLGGYYRQYERLMDHWRGVLPIEIYELQYETLIGDQQRVSRELVEFCGLAWDDACLNFHESKRPVSTASNWQVRRPLFKSAVARWRNYEQHLGPLRAALGVED